MPARKVVALSQNLADGVRSATPILSTRGEDVLVGTALVIARARTDTQKPAVRLE